MVKTDMGKDLSEICNDQTLQVSSIKKSQEADHKTHYRRDNGIRHLQPYSEEYLRKRVRKLRLKLLVKRVVQRFKENVNRKRTYRFEQFGQSEGEEIKVRIKAKRVVQSDSLKREDTTDSLRSLVTINKITSHMARPYSRPISRSSFEDAITAEYLNSDNMIYREATPDGDIMSVKVTGKSVFADPDDVHKVEIKYINPEDVNIADDEDAEQLEKCKDREKYLAQLKRTIVVTLPDIASDCNKKMKVKYDTGQKAFIGLSMKYPEMYHLNGFADIKQSLDLHDIPNSTAEYSPNHLKQESQSVRTSWQSELPSVSTKHPAKTLIQENVINQTLRKKENLEKVRPNSPEDGVPILTENTGEQEPPPNPNAKVNQKKVKIRTQVNEVNTKYSCSIPLIRSEDRVAERLSIVGTNPKSADGKRTSESGNTDKEAEQESHKIMTSKHRRNKMSVTLLNRKRAQANQDRYVRVSGDGEVVADVKEQNTVVDPLKVLEHRAKVNFNLLHRKENQLQRKLVKSEYSIRNTNREREISTPGTPLKPVNLNKNSGGDSGMNGEQRSTLSRQRTVTSTTKSTEVVLKKPDNMSEFVFRVFLRQNSFTKLPSYMDPKSEESLKQSHYLRHFTQFNTRDKVMARLSKMSGWRAKSFTCSDEYRRKNRPGYNNSAYL